MRHPHKDVAGLAVALGDERFQRLAERLVAGLVALDDLPHPLVENQQMVVFKKNPASQVAGFLFCKFAVYHTAKVTLYFTSS